MDGETKILAKVNGRQRNVSELSIRRHFKLNDEEGMSTLPGNELFENLSLMGYNILPNQRFSFQKGQFSHQWKFLIHTIMQCLSTKSTSFNEFNSNIATALVCLATNRTYNFFKMIFDDETVFLTRDVRYGEAFPTVTRLDAGQDRESIAKTSAMPYEASPRVTSLGGGEGRFAQEDAQNIEGINQREDLLVGDTVKDSDKSVDKGSDITDEMANVLGTLGSVNILASGGLRLVFTTASLSVATSSIVVSPDVATTSGSFLTAAIFTTTSVATPNIRVTRSSRGVVIECSSPISVNIPSINKNDKGKGKMTEPKQPKHDERDSEIARIHAESELEMMIAELDRSNEIVAKYLSEYKQAKVGLSHDEKVELIDELLMYQRNLAQVKKYQAQKISQLQRLKEDISTCIEPTQEQQSEEPKELSEEELKEMMELVPVEELYEALHVKYPIIDLEIYSEGQRKYWKIIRVRNHTEVYQIFDDMLLKFDQEDLDRL
uniref:Synaptobrevin, longin-like domain protein n=1 Tax=Tanacetum cinerariifolium TaxID=118510 RepID=A0A6L2KA37_TANCI|nr:synaptobrevin, longin-like domain protein [Tanacetum cinerariifolium]